MRIHHNKNIPKIQSLNHTGLLFQVRLWERFFPSYGFSSFFSWLEKGALVLHFFAIKWKTTIRGDYNLFATRVLDGRSPRYNTLVVVSLSSAQFLLVHPTIRSTTFPCHWVVALPTIDFKKDKFLSHQILCTFFWVQIMCGNDHQDYYISVATASLKQSTYSKKWTSCIPRF